MGGGGGGLQQGGAGLQLGLGQQQQQAQLGGGLQLGQGGLGAAQQQTGGLQLGQGIGAGLQLGESPVLECDLIPRVSRIFGLRGIKLSVQGGMNFYIPPPTHSLEVNWLFAHFNDKTVPKSASVTV